MRLTFEQIDALYDEVDADELADIVQNADSNIKVIVSNEDGISYKEVDISVGGDKHVRKINR